MTIASLPTRIALRLLGAFGFGFFLSMFTRTVANILKTHVQTDLVLTEEALSLSLGTSFFVAFMLMQLPLGVLLDRFDPRKVNASLFTIAGIGSVIFALADNAVMLATGRALMGLGFAGGMMGAMKTYTLWFPPDKLPRLNGIQFAIGVLGALSGTLPTHMMLKVMDWHELSLIFAGLTFGAALVYLLVAPPHTFKEQGETIGAAVRGLKRVYTDGFFWRVMPAVALTMGISQGIGTLYIVSWMTNVGGYTEHDASNVLLLTTSFSIVNFLLMGPLAEAVARRGFAPMAMPVFGVGVGMVAMLLLVLQWTEGAIAIWVIWTVGLGMNVLSFAAITRAFPVNLSARAVTALNMMGFASTAVSQWAIGRTLDLFPDDIAAGYQVAFGILLAVQAAGFAWYFLARQFGVGKRTMVEKAEAADG